MCGQWQFNLRAASKFTKWIGLAGPVEAVRAVGELLQTVFAALVIVSNANLAGFHFVMVRYGCDYKKLSRAVTNHNAHDFQLSASAHFNLVSPVKAPISDRVISNESYTQPDPEGEVRGMAFSPLYKSVPKAIHADPELYELLVLVDAIRSGQARKRDFAIKELKKRLKK